MSQGILLRIAAGISLLACAPASGQLSFVNWESPHIHPLVMTPDGTKLLAVNTPDNRLEVLSVTASGLVHVGSVPVGLDPVSVRARNDNEAWVVNHVSDSVSILDLDTLRVVGTIRTDDEPADVVFAGVPERAVVSCSQANTLLVIDPADPLAPIVDLPARSRSVPGTAAGFTLRVPVLGEDPRALAVSADGAEVYVAVFQSGNASTILPGGEANPGSFGISNVVNDPLSPYFDPSQPFVLGVNPPNPPPNDGDLFFPPIAPGLPPPPRVGMIVKRRDGLWLDDNNHDWTHVVSGADAAASGRPVGWELLDHDVGILNTTTLTMRYVGGLMNICMAVGVNPGTGQVTVVGTDATNEIRFEPVVNGRFLRVMMGSFDPANSSPVDLFDLNPHLDYTDEIPFQPIPQSVRDRSLGDPRGIVWTSDGAIAFITGMGSNSAMMLEANAVPRTVRTFAVGEGPTGLVLDSPRLRLYVLNKFDSSISTVDLVTLMETLPRVPLYDPTPAAIRVGRKHLYDTNRNSGLGHQSCASCHVDARTDGLAWDLGNPAGEMKVFNQNCNGIPGAVCGDWHPMKGPMTTQTLQDIIGKEPHHWRGDRNGLEEFAGAFSGLLGDDAPLPPFDMQEFEDFLATIHFPPNPTRNFDNSLPADVSLPGHFATGRFEDAGGLPAGAPLPNGNAEIGLAIYRRPNMDGALACVTCHTLPTGLGPDGVFVGGTFQPLPPGPLGEHHIVTVSSDGSTNRTMKIPHLRNAYEKTGFDTTRPVSTAGFGFLHDGSIDSLARFVSAPVFAVTSDQEVADLVSFVLALGGSDLPAGDPANPLEPPGPPSRDTHATVGWQVTLAAQPQPEDILLVDDMLILADAGDIGVVAKGTHDGLHRGYTYIGGGLFQSDRQDELVTTDMLLAQVGVGSEVTFTVVPLGTEARIGIDRDEDGFLDQDELDGCSDPADAASVPPQCPVVCGGASALECPAGLFCKLPLGQCCCQVEGVCEPIPKTCPAETDPVCGCDAVSYANECEASAASTSVSQHGSCSSTPVVPLAEDGLGLTCAADGDCPGVSTCPDGVCYVPKNRYLSFEPNHSGVPTAFRVTLTSSLSFPDDVGPLGWVGVPDADGVSPIVSEAVFAQDWPDVVQLGDCRVVPASVYAVSATLDTINFTQPLQLPTVPPPAPKKWGDCVANFNGVSWEGPNGVINFDDVNAGIKGWQEEPTAPPPSWLDLHGEQPNRVVNFADVQQLILAFQGGDYPYGAPMSCP